MTIHLIGITAKSVKDDRRKAVMNGMSSIATGALDRGNPERTADMIMRILSTNHAPDVAAAAKQAVEEVERDRTASIYVDVTDDLQITSRPSDMTGMTAKRYLSRVDLGIAALKYIRDPAMTTHEYLRLVPKQLMPSFGPIVKWAKERAQLIDGIP